MRPNGVRVGVRPRVAAMGGALGDIICSPGEVELQRNSLVTSIDALQGDLALFRESGATLPSEEVERFIGRLVEWLQRVAQEISVYVTANATDLCALRDWLHQKDTEVRGIAVDYARITGRDNPIRIPQPSIPWSLTTKLLVVGGVVAGGYLLWRYFDSTYPSKSLARYAGGQRKETAP